MGNTGIPLVSICCITYNHVDYIRDALDGFLMQKTDFSFEIIIHDDASTDGTIDIIREYERKYPNIIKPIYQTENQYSKGEKATLFTIKVARGKYIAFCEGDDYWIDPLKLQKQIIEMEKHPDCYICFHPTLIRWVDGGKKDEILALYSDKITLFPVEMVIQWWGMFMPSASIVINRVVIPQIVSFFNLAKESPVGDYYLQVLCAENGGALYLNDIMSIYRSGVRGSWTVRFIKDSSLRESWFHSTLQSHDKIDAFMNNKYTKLFAMRKRRYYSALIKSLTFDINTKKSIIYTNMDQIDTVDWILWNTVFKYPFMVNILRYAYPLVSRVIGRRNRGHLKVQASREKSTRA
jgi:glycosyltransferase involved in cell wall biosynthesis